MKKMFLSWMAMATIIGAIYCQSTFRATILDTNSQDPLIGVNLLLEEHNKGNTTDLGGNVSFENLPDGICQMEFARWNLPDSN